MPLYYLSPFFILIRLTLAYDLHIERWLIKGTSVPILCPHRDRHVGLIKGRSPLERIPGSLLSSSLVSPSFRVPFLHLCAFVQVFVFQRLLKKKKVGKKFTVFNDNVSHLILYTFSLLF